MLSVEQLREAAMSIYSSIASGVASGDPEKNSSVATCALVYSIAGVASRLGGQSPRREIAIEKVSSRTHRRVHVETPAA